METKDLQKDIEELKETMKQQQEEETSSINLATIMSTIILNWQWFALSFIICMCLAFLYLRYKSPVYQLQTKMLIKDEQNPNYRRTNQMLSNMTDLGFMTNSAGIDNEVEILQSHILAEQAVKDLKLNVHYKMEGRVKDREVYKTNPVIVELDEAHTKALPEMTKAISMKIKLNKDGKYEVKGRYYMLDKYQLIIPEPFTFEAEFDKLPVTLHIGAGYLTFKENPAFPMEDRYEKVYINSIKVEGISYVNKLSVEPSSKMTSIAVISLKEKDVKKGIDYLNQLVECYNRQANEDKNEIAVKTEEFINDRLVKITNELGATEGQLESYKKRNRMTELKIDATSNIQQTNVMEQKLAEANTQLQLLNHLKSYVENPANKYQVIPSNVGLTDPSSTALINAYNQAVQQRNRLLVTYSENSPNVVPLTEELDKGLASIKAALNQAYRSAEITRNSVQQQYNTYQSRVVSTPGQERVLTQIGRQQEVMSDLYLTLLQKREENSISLAATADKGKVIDDPQFMGKISPKKSIIGLLALICAIGLPLLVIYLVNLLRYKIEGHDDVAKLTSMPIIADVPVANPDALNKAGIVVHENTNNQMEEIFRSMRTNIQFMLKKDEKVVLFTSSTSGEGKTFNAANLAMSFALLGKKVVLCGLDIRKPRLGELFGMRNTSKIGITNFLNMEDGTKQDLYKEIIPSGVNDNLHLLMAGPIPPNPAELLARETLGKAIDYLKEDYDYIVLDTAPVGLVTDTFHIARLANVSVIITRADYTPKDNVAMMNEIAVKQGKLPNACIVLNGIDMSKKKYGYYYGYGKYGKYGRYGHYGKYGRYGNYGNYGSYSNSHYSNKDDNSIKTKRK